MAGATYAEPALASSDIDAAKNRELFRENDDFTNMLPSGNCARLLRANCTVALAFFRRSY
jgi:hypothetical protein